MISTPVSERAKAILCGIFLSKFNESGLGYLGFDSYLEAYNTLGLVFNTKPASIKNYRDEFDPVFPGSRVGRRGRPMRAYCKVVLDRFGDLGLDQMGSLIRLYANLGSIRSPEGSDNTESASYERRQLTGRAAENFFLSHFREENRFYGYDLFDVRLSGCGYDFEMRGGSVSEFLAVEVKGVCGSSGSILLSEKEHRVAREMRDRYILFVVKGLKEVPVAESFEDPLNGLLQFERMARATMEISWRLAV